MHETTYKQAVMDSLSHYKSINDTVPVEESVEEPVEESTEESTEETPEEPVEESTKESTEETPEELGKDVSDGDSSADDVSDGDSTSNDVSTGDVSGGDTSSGDVDKPSKETGANATAPIYTTCAYEPKPNLWESNIAEYDTTDGLLLLILIFTIINTAFNVLRKRG